MLKKYKIRKLLANPNGVYISSIQRELNLGYLYVMDYVDKLIFKHKVVKIDDRYRLIKKKP